MKLQQIETWATVPPTGIGGTFWVIVRLTTDNGIQGIGECYGIPVSGDIACQMVEDTFERYIAGESPFNVETLFRRVYSAGFTQRPDVSMMGVFSGMEIASRDGELNFNNSDPALVTFISFAPRGDSSTPIHPIGNTDLIGILVDGHVHTFQVTGGNYNALNVIHVRGTATLVPGATAEPRIFPTNYVLKTGAASTQVIESAIQVKGNNYIKDHGAAIGIINPDDNDLWWFVWHPDASETNKPIKYVARKGSDHNFQCYDENNENVQVKAEFKHSEVNIKNKSGENTIAYSITDAHYFTGAFQIKNYAGTYENLKVDLDGTLWGREGYVPTVDRQIANKKYVDDAIGTSGASAADYVRTDGTHPMTGYLNLGTKGLDLYESTNTNQISSFYRSTDNQTIITAKRTTFLKLTGRDIDGNSRTFFSLRNTDSNGTQGVDYACNIYHLADPTDNHHGANKQYVDSVNTTLRAQVRAAVETSTDFDSLKAALLAALT